jgi:hypothetical protein
MALVTIYRAAYVFNGGDAPNVHFSGWVREEDKADVLEYLASVQPAGNGSPEGVAPTFIGWEEKNLDFDVG